MGGAGAPLSGQVRGLWHVYLAGQREPLHHLLSRLVFTGLQRICWLKVSLLFGAPVDTGKTRWLQCLQGLGAEKGEGSTVFRVNELPARPS